MVKKPLNVNNLNSFKNSILHFYSMPQIKQTSLRSHTFILVFMNNTGHFMTSPHSDFFKVYFVSRQFKSVGNNPKT